MSTVPKWMKDADKYPEVLAFLKANGLKLTTVYDEDSKTYKTGMVLVKEPTDANKAPAKILKIISDILVY